MGLTTNRDLLIEYGVSEDMLARFDEAYPNIEGNQEVDLLNIIDNGYNTVPDVIWGLRATVQDSKSVSVEFVKRCADDVDDLVDADKLVAAEVATSAAISAYCKVWAANYTFDLITEVAIAAASDDSNDCGPTHTAASDAVAAERAKQKQDLLELLS
jgi:hypothetical protein